MFAVTSEGSLGRILQPDLHRGWLPWEDIGVTVRSAPAALQNADGRAEVFAAGEDGRLAHLFQESPLKGGWSDWQTLGPAIQGDPLAARNASGHVELFARGPSGRLGHMWQHDPNGPSGWSQWVDLGPEIQDRPAVCANADGRLEVFAIGPDGCLGHIWQTSPDGVHGWSQWDSFGHELRSSPAVFPTADGRLEVFAIAADGRLGHVWQWQAGGTAGWSDWHSFGHNLQSPPAVFANADGRLEVFAIGPDGRLGHVWQLGRDGAGGWSDWDSFGHAIRSAPAVFANADGRLEVFAIGPDGCLGHVWQWHTGGTVGWSEWESMGPALSEKRLAICQTSASLTNELRSAIKAERLFSRVTRETRAVLSADVCVIGAGPAGITVADGLLRAGAKVTLVESGGWHQEPDAQDLNHGDADGPIIKGHLRYLYAGRGRQVQGSAAAWDRGMCMPLRSIDFARRSWVTHSGWPLSHDELAAYEARAADTFGFELFGPPRPEGPLVRLSYQFPDDPLLFRARFVELLSNPGFRAELDATAVELSIKDDRIESVRLACSTGGELRVLADTVVMAAGGVENARLLLLNQHSFTTVPELAGRFFMDHPHVLAGTVVLPDALPLRSLLDGQREQDVLALTDEAQRDERLLNTSVELRPLSGVPRSGPVECELYVRAEQAPNPDSRLVLGDRRDRFGCRQPYLRWLLRDEDWDSVVRTATLVAAALEQNHSATTELLIRSEQPWPWDPADPTESGNATWGNHHMGTTRMADDPAEGVVDRNCLVHGTTNLYIAGSSVFPTGGCANPTFEIVALAHRLADHLGERPTSHHDGDTAAPDRASSTISATRASPS